MFLYLVASRRIRCIFKRRGGSHEEKHIRAMFESHPGTDIGSETRSEMAKRRDLVKEVVSLVGPPLRAPIATMRRSGRGVRPPSRGTSAGMSVVHQSAQSRESGEGISG